MTDYSIIIFQQIEDCRNKSEIVLQFTIDPKYTDLNHLLDSEYSKLFKITSKQEGLHSALNCNNLIFLNIMTNLRRKSYNIVTSNAYLDIYTNCIVKSFYYEKIISNNIITTQSNNSQNNQSTNNSINNQVNNTNVSNNIQSNTNSIKISPKSEASRKNSLLVVRSEVIVESPLELPNESNETKNQTNYNINNTSNNNNNQENDNKTKITGPPPKYSFTDRRSSTIDEPIKQPTRTSITSDEPIKQQQPTPTTTNSNFKIQSTAIRRSSIVMGSGSTEVNNTSNTSTNQSNSNNKTEELEINNPSKTFVKPLTYNDIPKAPVGPPPTAPINRASPVPMSTNPLSNNDIPTTNISKPSPPPPPMPKSVSTINNTEDNSNGVSRPPQPVVKPSPTIVSSSQSLSQPPIVQSQPKPTSQTIQPTTKINPTPSSQTNVETPDIIEPEENNDFSYDNVVPTIPSSKTDDAFQFTSPLSGITKVPRVQGNNLDNSQKNAEYFRRLKEEEKQRIKEEEAKLNAFELQKKRENDQQAQQHDANKTQHYAKLGGAFVNRNSTAPILGGGRLGGRSINR